MQKPKNEPKKIADYLPGITEALTPEDVIKYTKREDKPLHGKANQYKKELISCKFKLICYFHKTKSGQFYSFQEKQFKKHRKEIPSIDLIPTSNGYYIYNHEAAYNKLLDYINYYQDRLEQAIIILNDYAESLEHTIFTRNFKILNTGNSVTPVFSQPDENGNIFFECLTRSPLRTDKMRF